MLRLLGDATVLALPSTDGQWKRSLHQLLLHLLSLSNSLKPLQQIRVFLLSGIYWNVIHVCTFPCLAQSFCSVLLFSRLIAAAVVGPSQISDVNYTNALRLFLCPF